MRTLLPTLVVASLVTYSVSMTASQADNQFDQLVTPEVLYGVGNTNGGFAIDRHRGVEIGLRAQTRFPVANDTTGLNSNGDGTYSMPAGAACPDAFPSAPFPLCLATPVWNFTWSVNTDWDLSTAGKVNQFVYQIGMDSNPGPGTSFTLFDPITPSLVAPAWDHAFGDNTTANGAGDETLINYAANLAGKNVVQNSWNYEFFNNVGTSLASFNPAVDGNYVIFLRAIDPVKKKVVAETMIQVLVGNAPKVPRRKIELPKVGRDRDHDDDDDDHDGHDH
ncbi:MAG: hypothetical protein ABL986_08930 [Vicinamibacterales bacterium]